MRTNTIKNFAMRFATIAIVLLTVGVGSAWGAYDYSGTGTFYKQSDIDGNGYYVIVLGAGAMTKSASSNYVGYDDDYDGSAASISNPSTTIVLQVTDYDSTNKKYYIRNNSASNYYLYSSADKKITYGSTAQYWKIATVSSKVRLMTAQATVVHMGYVSSSGYRPYSNSSSNVTQVVAVYKWKCTVSYNANGGTGTMTDSNSPYAYGATVTVKSNSFTRDGYTFDGWNTKADGTGADKAASATFTITQDTTLYAKWTASCSSQTVTVSDGDTGSDAYEGEYDYGDDPISLTLSKTGSGTVTWTSDATDVATVSGNSSGATVTIVGAGIATITASVAADATYCAGEGEYTLLVNSVAPTLSHNTSGKELTVSSITSTGATFSGGVVTNKGGDASLSSYGFIVGTSADVKYKDRVTQAGTNEDYTINTAFGSKSVTGLTPNTTYYVRAIANNTGGHIGYSTAVSFTTLQSYAISYNNNGGSGSMASTTKDHGVNFTLPANAGSMTKTGYHITGWLLGSSSGTHYDLSGTYTTDAAATFYAEWTANTYQVAFNANGGTGSMSNEDFTYGASAKALTTCSFTPPTHKYFYGWADTKAEADAGTRDYEPGESVSNLTTTNGGTVTLYAVWLDHTFTNYRTMCCTELGTINGSVSFTNPTEAVVSWDNIANVSSWTVKYKIHGAGSWSTTNVSASAPYTKVSSNDSRKCTITGLTCNTAYDFLIIANPASGYCDNEETLDNSGSGYNSGKWNVDYDLTGVQVADGIDEGDNACGDFSVTFEPSSAAYELPETITVTIGGETATVDTDYEWDDETGELTIDEDKVTGAIAVTVEGVEVGCIVDPTVGAASLSGTFNLTTVGVTVATSGAGDYCEWTDYGFVCGTSANPALNSDGTAPSGVIKEQVGTSGAATTWSSSITGSFTTGTTYYYRAYGKNGKTGAEFVYGTGGTFIPRSVTFNSNGGSEVATVYVNSGGTVSAPSAPTRTGYTFSKWQLSSSDYSFSSAVSANITLDAVWTANSYTVTLDNNNATSGSSQTVSATYDADMPLKTTADGTPAVAALSRTGYTFTGWWDEVSGGKQYYSYSGSPAAIASANTWDKTSATTLKAQWTANNYTITLDNEDADEEGTEEIAVTYDANTNLTSSITKPTKTGYLFGGYYTEADGEGTQIIDENGAIKASVASYTSSTKQWVYADDVTLYAKWTAVHTVTWYVDGEEWSSGVVTGNTSVVDGEKVSALPTAPTKSDCDDAKVFMGWRATAIVGTSATAPSGIFTTVAGSPEITDDMTFYAVFATEGKAARTTLYSEPFKGTCGDNTDWASASSYFDNSNTASITTTDGWKVSKYTTETSEDGYTGASGGSHTFSGSEGKYLIFNFGDKSAYTDLQLSFGFRNNAAGGSSRTISCVISGDGGSSWGSNIIDVASITDQSWHFVSYDIPNASRSNLKVKYTPTAGNPSRVDDIKLTGCLRTYSDYVTTCATCEEDATYTNTTPTLSEIGCTSATLTMEEGLATVGSEGCHISDYGFVISTSDNPAIGGDGVTKLQVGTSDPTTGEDFSYDVTGLTKGTHYYVRAYAINKHGTAYSTSTNFWTQNVSSIAITTAPTKTNYIVGETFDPTGMVVTATMASSETEDVTEDVTYSDDALTSGTNQDFEINYTLCETEKSVNQKINVYTLSVSEGTNADKGDYSASANIITISSLTTHYTAEFSVTNGSVSSNGDGTYTVTPDGKGNVSVTINYRAAAQVKVYYKANGITLTSLTQDVYESETTTLPTGSSVSSAMSSLSVPLPDADYANFWGWSETDFDVTTTEPTLVTGTPTITAEKTYYAVFTNMYKKTLQPSDFNGTYSVNDGEQTYDGVGYYVDNICKQSEKIQFRNYPGYLYSTSALQYIKKIEIADLDLVVNACSNNSGTVDGSAITPSGTGPYVYSFPDNKQYFKITGKGGTDKVSYIDIFYATSTPKYMTYKNYTISLDNEGGSGSSSTTARYKGTLSDVTPPTRTGYSFDGYWNGDNGTGTQLIDEDGKWIASVSTYTDGDTKWNKNTGADLYAKWTPVTLTFTRGLYWNTADNWSPACVPTIEHDVIIASNCWVDNNDAKAKSVKINFDVRLRINDDGGLVVAEDIKAQHEADGAYEATKKNDVYIETNVLGTGGLVCGSASTTTEVTYIFYSRSYRYETWYINQYIGIPFASMDPYDWYGLTIFEYDTEKDKWKTPVLVDGKLKPFTAYNVISKISGSFAQQYYTEGIMNLPGTSGTETLTCGSRVATAKESTDPGYYSEHPYFDNNGDYMFANSWTAPISIGAIDDDDISGDGEDLVQCIYIFNAGYVSSYDLPKELGEEAGQWSAFPIASADYMDNAVIQAGQAFLVTSKVANATLTLDYGKHVYTPALDNGMNLSPRRAPRRNHTSDAPNVLKIVVNTDSTVADKVYLFERSDYTFGYDNGWDGVKIMGSASFPRLYALNGAEKMSVSAVPDVEGIELGFKAGTDTNAYYFSFQYNDDEPLYLYDKQTMLYTRISNEATYSFTTDDTDEHARFIITRSNAPWIETGTETLKGDENRAEKFFDNNMLFIRRGEKVYNVDGSLVK